MGKINLFDSLYHGVLNMDFDYNNITKFQLKKLQSILKLGYLISPNSKKVKECECYAASTASWYPSNITCLSCHPFTTLPKNVHEREGHEYFLPYSGYSLTMSSFALILDKSMLNDAHLSFEPGNLKREVLVNGDIDLKRYLLGICNTGIDIDREILFHKYYILYKTKQISEEELKNILKLSLSYMIDEWDYINYYDKIHTFNGLTKSEEAHNSLIENNLDQFLRHKELYDKIMNVLNEVELEIPIIDSEGDNIQSIDQQCSKLELIKKMSAEVYGTKKVIPHSDESYIYDEI